MSNENDITDTSVVATVPPVDTPPEATSPVDEGNDTVIETNLWDELSEDDDSEDEDVIDTPAEDEPVPVVDEETPTPAASPEEEPPAETPPETPTPPEQPTEEPTPEPEPTPEVPKTLTPEEQKAKRDELVTQLEPRFQLTEEESLQMVTDPGKILPKLQARMFADMYSMMTESFRAHLPEAIQYNIRAEASRTEKVDTFFTTWPKLNKAKHGVDIANVATMYAKLNPKASEEEVVNNVGMQVMFMHGITPDMIDTSVPPATPPADIVPTPRQVPAVHGVSAPSQSSNEWSAMADEMLDDD